MHGVRGVLLDVDGVLTISWRPIPGAPEAVARLRDNGLPIRFATNTTVLTRAQLVDRLRAAGFDADEDEVITAPSVTAGYLRTHHPGRPCFLIAKGDVAQDLDGVNLVSEAAEVVVISGAEEFFTYEALNAAFNFLMNGAAFVAMHRNMYWRTDEGLRLDAGAFIAGLEAATGTTAAVVGKPARAFFEQAVASLGLEARVAVMVGDDVTNDVIAAQSAGLRGVLVRTGKFSERAVAEARGSPDLVIDAIADLPDRLERL
jgi:HAD superfamily hydrolase (TIGR01458 family)